MSLSHKRFHVLDSFCGIAALFVVLFHMHYMGAISESIFFRNSNLFVEFFFILSGFVLTHSYMLKKHLSFRNFFISRTFRLLPLHLFVLLLFIALEFGKLYAYKHGFHFNNVPFTAASNIADIVPNILLLQSWLPNVSTVSWNYPSWSISVEYYLYMIFFLTLLLKVFNRYIVWILFVLVASLLYI
jgi:peptidoglycan/LPS O-acetylase OafA/YrhL